MKRNILLPFSAIISAIILSYFFGVGINSPIAIFSCVLFLSLLFVKRIRKLTVILALVTFLFTLLNAGAKLNYIPDNIKDTTKVNAQITSAITYKDNKVTFYAKNLDDNNKRNKILVNIYTDKPDEITGLEIGDIYEFEGNLRLPKPKNNYGGFDYRLYLKTVNVYSYINAKSYKFVKKGNLFLHMDKLFDLRESIKNIIYENIDDSSSSSLLMGIIFSDKGVDSEIKENFNDSGLAHVLAVSGMHIGLIYAFLIFILDLFGLSTRSKNFIVIPFLMIYIVLSGFTPSAMRAGLFCIILSFAKMQKFKDPDSLSITLFIASILLLANPLLLFNLSFQLSFLSVIGIVFLTPILNFFIYDKDLKKKAPILTFVLRYSFVCIVCQIFTFPVIVNSFTKVPLLSIISNLLVVWAVAPVMILSIVGMVLNKLIFSSIIFFIIKLLLQYMVIVTDTISNFSFNSLELFHLNIFYIIIYYYIVFMLFRYISFNKITMFFLCLIIVCSIGFSRYQSGDGLNVHFLDLGQADGICVITKDKKCIFFDGGNTFGRDNTSFVLSPFLNYFHIKEIDTAFITHTDSDHYEAMTGLKTSIKRAYIPKTDKKDVLNLSENINIANKNEVVKIDDDTKVTILTEVKDISRENNENNIVYLLEHKSNKILITGDMTYNQEREILEENNIDCEILKSAHHGSFDELSDEFLEKTSPDFVIIQSGNNPYNLPNDEYIKLLKGKGIKYFNTRDNGAIHFEIKNNIKLRKVFIEDGLY